MGSNQYRSRLGIFRDWVSQRRKPTLRQKFRRNFWMEHLEGRTLLAVDASTSLVFLDASLPIEWNPAEFIDGDQKVVVLDADRDPIDQISETLRSYRNLSTVQIVSHGAPGKLLLGGKIIDRESLASRKDEVVAWGEAFHQNGDWLLVGCRIGFGLEGRAFLETLAEWTDTEVASSEDGSGPSDLGGDWDLEVATGPINTSSLDWLDRQVKWNGLLPITIYAAGDTGTENMDLLIDSQVVQTWTNVGGNANAGQFVSFTYDAASNISPDRIRVAFTNDEYVEGSVDRNLRVDKIQVDSIVYETEAPSVFSTGTWLPADGITPGFRQSEYLHSDGYFQYAVNTGSIIQILAAGQVGPESMTIQINGIDGFTWQNIGAGAITGNYVEYTYRASSIVTPSQVRIAFTNDFYAPPIDYNLRVDKIIIDGVEYETESPSVFSTGTYVPAQNGIVPGFWQSEWLNSSGYFQFGANSLRPGSLGLESSTYAVGETGGSVNLAVVRTGGSDGIVSIDYKMVAGTATSPSDFTLSAGTLTFANGETRKTVPIPIMNDTLREPPESFQFVIENPRGGAALLAPRTATIEILDDDLVLPNFSSFPNSTGLRLNGNASITSSTLQLTPNTTNRRGTAFYTTPIPLHAATSFQTQFRMKTVGATTGAEGFTFIVQNATTAAASLGTAGIGLAYGGIAKSFAIEFDTAQNAGEINNNHVSLWRDGNMVNSLGTKTSTIDFNSGADVFAWVDYYGESDQLSLFLSNTSSKPTTPLLTTSLDLFGIVGSQAYFGFGAATSTLTNAHRILNWSLNLNRPTTPPVVPPTNLISETFVSGLNQPIAARFSADGRNLYVALKEGRVLVVRDGVLQATPWIDIRNQVNDTRDRGLLDIALHPNFATNPYIYLLFTYDPPEVNQHLSDPLAGPDKPGNRAGRLIRVTADAATNYTTAVPGSEVVLLGKNSTWNHFNPFINSTIDLNAPQGGVQPNGTYVQDFIASDSESHTVGSLAWGNDGSLLVSIGDGASYNSVDPRATRVQDIDSLSGKILRIDPLNGLGYSNNPFQNGDLTSNRSKVYQLGLRNPFRIATNPTSGQLFVGDVGWTQWEEINAGGAGANFGWPYFEGGNGTNIRTPEYQNLAKAQTFYASGQIATPSIYALNHAADGINAIVMGDFYTGSTYPSQYQNNLFFNDLGQGIVRNARLGSDGRITSVETFTTGAAYVVQIFQGRDGNLYFVDLDDGLIGRWRFVTASSSQASASSAMRSSTTSTSAIVAPNASVSPSSTSNSSSQKLTNPASASDKNRSNASLQGAAASSTPPKGASNHLPSQRNTTHNPKPSKNAIKTNSRQNAFEQQRFSFQVWNQLGTGK